MFLLQADGPASRSTSTRSATTSSRSASRCSSPATPGAQGPRPQRAAGPGHRLRADARLAEPDQRREPRQPGARRPRDARRGVHRRTRTARPPGPLPTDGRIRHRDGRGRRGAPRSRSSPSSPGDGLAAIFRDFGVAARRPRRPVREPEHRRAARGRRARSTPARSCSCPTTRTSSSPRARSPR